MRQLLLIVALLMSGVAWAAERPRMEVVFVLDSTGSMSGLIEGAKQKIWSIANDFIRQEPRPDLRIGLVTYRDRGDAYVTRRFELTDDIDKVHSDLRSIEAGGGGDGPESVNEALDEAVNKLGWSNDAETLKIIFLVGDFPPHMDYENDVKYPKTCEAAARRNIIINTIQCGNVPECTTAWQDIARLAEGKYVQLSQSGDMVAVSTPFDAEMAELSGKIGATAIPYGSREAQAQVLAKALIPTAAPMPAAADRAAYNLASGGVAVQGRGDLVGDIEAGRVKLEAVERKELPAEMQALPEAELAKKVREQSATRARLNGELAEVSRKREEYIAAERRKLAEAGKGDSFDEQVANIVREQAAKKRGR